MKRRRTDISFSLSLKNALTHRLISVAISGLYYSTRFFRTVRKRQPIEAGRKIEVILTGTFHSNAWIDAFLAPLAAADHCRNVVVVTTFDIAEQPGIVAINPPRFLRRIAGDVFARLIVFAWHAIRRKSELVGGFYISPNALIADLVASMYGARSMYVCVGGPMEIIDGGLHGESRIFEKLARADLRIEQQVLRAVRRFDVVVPMGKKAVDWFLGHRVSGRKIRKITGAVDSRHFVKPRSERAVDLIFVGRLAPIKDLELLLRSVRVLRDNGASPTVRIVGKGPHEAELKEIARALKLEHCVQFAGFVPNVADELKNAKCFVLTSRSEGVSLALIEAMLAGAVPVVADVGDLADVVQSGENGFLVNSRSPAAFANCINDLLSDDKQLSKLSQAAYNTALSFDIHTIAGEWDSLLREIAE